jgi:hypothetical protein
MALGVLALVPALAALAPAATFAAVTPPTVETTVAPCVPVTSPGSGPEKLLAVAAVATEPAIVVVLALPLRFPVNEPAKELLTLVAIVAPAKLFEPVNAFVPSSRGILPESWKSEISPRKFVAVWRQRLKRSQANVISQAIA